MESENKESTMAYCEEGILKAYRSRSPLIDTDLIRAISPLNTPPTDTASEIRLHGSVVLVRGPVLEFDDDGVLGKSLCTKLLRLLDKMT